MNKFVFLFTLIALISLACAKNYQSILPNLVKPRTFPVPNNSESKRITIREITQPINHFNVNDNRTFLQRYMEDCTYHEPNGPIILFIGDQLNFFSWFIESGPVREIAEMHNGCLMQLELRYSGQSMPFQNFTLEKWQYLKVDQMIEDIASFIKQIKSSDERYKDSKVILVGLSTSGSYVSWFRVKHPELSVGSWASSSPIAADPNASEFKYMLGELFREIGGNNCYDKINEGFKAIEEDLQQGYMTRINESFKVCEGFNPLYEKDSKNLVYLLGNMFYAPISINTRNEIENMCKRMSEANDNVEAIGAAVRPWLGSKCMDMTYNKLIEEIQQIDDFISLFYLSCYQYGWWLTTDAKNQPFGTIAKLDHFVDMCRDVFNDTSITKEFFYQTANKINEEFGGWSGNYTNLYTTQGELDPYQILGLSHNDYPTSHTEIIANASHANDLYYFVYNQTDPIKTAILGAKCYISKWLN